MPQPSQVHARSHFKTKLLCPATREGNAAWGFLRLPKDASDKLPRRGRTTVDGTLNGHHFQATLEPDGQLSHWLRVDETLRKAAGVQVGDMVTLEIAPVDQEPEPAVPADLLHALSKAEQARRVWDGTTTIARLDWIHWMVSAKQAKTRAKRIDDACHMLASGKQRVCCFDPSGYYSKALRAPESAAGPDDTPGGA